MTPLASTRTLLLVALTCAAPLAAQETASQPVATPPTAQEAASQPAAADGATPQAAAACYPACREGFTCLQGRCVSLCNPPCPAGLECVEGRRCEPPTPGSRAGDGAYEPPPPPVKTFQQRSHTLLAFHLGLPGNVERDGQELDAATTLGFNIRADEPVAGYLLIGPMLQLGAWSPDVTPEARRNYYVDLDFVLRLRLPITTAKLDYQAWLGMPIGITANVLGESQDDVSTLGIGWNIGVLFGGAVHFTSKLGVFVEGGWLQHKMSHAGDVGPDLDFALRQWCLNLGLIVKN